MIVMIIQSIESRVFNENLFLSLPPHSSSNLVLLTEKTNLVLEEKFIIEEVQEYEFKSNYPSHIDYSCCFLQFLTRLVENIFPQNNDCIHILVLTMIYFCFTIFSEVGDDGLWQLKHNEPTITTCVRSNQDVEEYYDETFL